MRHTPPHPCLAASPTRSLLLWAEGLRGLRQRARHFISADITLCVCNVSWPASGVRCAWAHSPMRTVALAGGLLVDPSDGVGCCPRPLCGRALAKTLLSLSLSSRRGRLPSHRRHLAFDLFAGLVMFAAPSWRCKAASSMLAVRVGVLFAASSRLLRSGARLMTPVPADGDLYLAFQRCSRTWGG